MKKQKVNYRYIKYEGKPLQAKREISYGIKLSSRLILDELSFNFNKKRLDIAIDYSIDMGNKEMFLQLSEIYIGFLQK